MKTLKLMAGMALLGLFLANCSKDEPAGIEPNPEQEAPEEDTPETENLQPRVESVDPLEGPKGTIVTISGADFGLDNSLVKVAFDGTEAPVVSLSESVIQVEVPQGISTGNLTVEIGDSIIIAGTFTYIKTLQVTTFAGTTSGLEDGTRQQAKFDSPFDMVQDSQGNFFISDTDNNVIRKIDTDGNVSIYAGKIDEPHPSIELEDGFRLDARFNYPTGIAIDKQDNIYIADSGNSAIRKIIPAGEVFTVAKKFVNSIGVRDSLVRPNGITVDDLGIVYIADTGNHRILKMDPNGRVQLLAGSSKGFTDGVGYFSQFNFPTGMTIGNDGDLYVVDSSNNSIRKVTLNGEVTTVAGTGTSGNSDGSIQEATFDYPTDVEMDLDGNLFIADANNHSIRLISPNGEVSKYLGNGEGDTDGDSSIAQLNYSHGLSMDSGGTLFIVDTDNSKIKKVNLE